MPSPTFDLTGQRSYRSTSKSLITREELKADLFDRLKEYDLSFTLEVLADIAGSIEPDCEDESESWFLDSLLIRSLIPYILH